MNLIPLREDVTIAGHNPNPNLDPNPNLETNPHFNISCLICADKKKKGLYLILTLRQGIVPNPNTNARYCT